MAIYTMKMIKNQISMWITWASSELILFSSNFHSTKTFMLDADL